MYLMGMPLYTSLDESEKRFDGHRAHEHLTTHLAMTIEDLSSRPEIGSAFESWIARCERSISVRGEPRFLVPPAWF